MTQPSLSSMSPPVEVPAPKFEPYHYGLLSAAEVIDGDGRWELGGVTYATAGCPNMTTEWITRCPVDPPPPGPPPEKNIPVGLEEVVGKPFLLYDAASCYPHTGRTEEELLDLAESNLIAGEQEKIEEKFWATMRLGAVIVAPPAGDTAFNICVGVGVLDDLIAKNHGGIGVLHAPRFLIAGMKRLDLTSHELGGHPLTDPADNKWAFGAGYNRQGPPTDTDPINEAPAGHAWIYATGPIVLRRSRIQTHATFGIHDNERRALAERSYVLTAECPTLAILVRIPEC